MLCASIDPRAPPSLIFQTLFSNKYYTYAAGAEGEEAAETCRFSIQYALMRAEKQSWKRPFVQHVFRIEQKRLGRGAVPPTDFK